MAADPIPYQLESPDDALHEIEGLIDQVARRSKEDLPPHEFYAELLACGVRALAAAGGVIWSRGPAGQWVAEHQINLAQSGIGEDREAARQHTALLRQIAKAGQTRLVPPRSGPGSETTGWEQDDELTTPAAPSSSHGPANLTEYLLIFCPVVVEQELAAIIEIFQRPGASAGAQRGYRQLLAAIGELAAEFLRNRRLRDLRSSESLWGQFAQFALQAHASLELEPTAYALVNEGRRVVGCDRVSVLVRRGNACRLLAISGADAFDRRADFVVGLERLAAAVLAVQEPLWYAEGASSLPLESLSPETLPPEIEARVQAVIDSSHVRALGVIPLIVRNAGSAASSDGNVDRAQAAPDSSEPLAVGALIVEQFHGDCDEPLRRRAEAVCEHAAVAVRNALEHQSLPLAGLSRRFCGARRLLEGRRRPKALAIGLVAVGLVAALALVPADFEIEATGALQPQERRDVFSPCDGVVTSLNAAHARQFAAGDVLLVLRDPALELEFRRVEGETLTAQKRLDAIEAARVESRRDDSEERERYQNLTAEEEEVKELLAGLGNQRKILEAQRAELEVRSPIAGQVLTWNVDELLAARPVARGQTLLAVANVAGPWTLELRLPDEQVGHVLAAAESAKADHRLLKVTYLMATDPGVKYTGEVQRIALATETDRNDVPGVTIDVKLAADSLPELRPGATAVARIDCGRRAIGYVWLHDLIDAVRTWLFF